MTKALADRRLKSLYQRHNTPGNIHNPHQDGPLSILQKEWPCYQNSVVQNCVVIFLALNLIKNVFHKKAINIDFNEKHADDLLTYLRNYYK